MLKRTWYPQDGSQPIPMGDDSQGNKISLGLPVQERPGIEHWSPYGGAWQKVFDNGCKLNGRVWRVDRDHGTEAKAIAFLESHNDALPALGFLSLESDAGSERFLVDASIVPRCVAWDGRSTTWEYTVRGGAILNTRPSL